MDSKNLDSSLKINFQEEEDQPPAKPKTKLIKFIICSIIIFSALSSAFTIWKSHLKSPSNTIQIACSKTLDDNLCIKSLLSLHKNTSTPSKSITISKVIVLSIEASINKINDQVIPDIKKTQLTETNKWRFRSLIKCHKLLNDSLGLLKRSLRMLHSEEGIFCDANFTIYMELKITDARNKIAACRNELIYWPVKNEVLDMKMEQAWFFVDNILSILYYRDEIRQELNPTIVSVWNALFMSGAFTMVLAYLPFVFSVLLVIWFLRGEESSGIGR